MAHNLVKHNLIARNLMNRNQLPSDYQLRKVARLAASVLTVAAMLCSQRASAQPSTQQSAPALARPKVGLVLSGGGARGIAHIGVLRVLEELRVPVDIVVGASFGAIIGGAFAGGQGVAELERLVLATDWSAVLQDRLPRNELSFRRREDDSLLSSRLELGVTRDGVTLPRSAFSSAEVERLLRKLVPNTGLVPVDALPLIYRAVATDMLTGAKAVPTAVPLFTAMRASMSVPGVFPPISVDGRILGDGGLVSNLPVQLARDLGADIIIAVNIGTPLGGAESLGSALGIAQQMISILTEQNVQESVRALQPQDILIVPDLGGQQMLDFSSLARGIAAGVAATRARADRLQALAVDATAYAQFRERLQPSEVASAATPRVASVRVERRDEAGASTALPLGRISLRPGDPLTAAALDEAARQVQRQLEAERVDAIVTGAGATRDVVLLPVESPFGLSRLRLGVELQANSYRNNDFTLAGLYRLGGIGPRGSEWRTVVRIGSSTDLQTEYYEPWAVGSAWFTVLGAAYRGYDFRVYSQSTFDLLTSIDVKSSLLTAGFGRQLGEAGQARLGLQYRRLNLRGIDGESEEAKGNTLFADLTLDTLDSLGFPTRGYFVKVSGEYFGFNPEDQTSFYSARYDALFAHRTGPWAGHEYVGGQRDTSGVYPLALGGFLRLSGAPPSSILGSEVVFGRAVLAREVGSLPLPLGGALRLGGSIETGRTSFRNFGVAGGKTRYGSSLFVVGDTRLGPVYLAVGNTPGTGTAVYLFLGSVLLPSGLLR
jgi:NTE family protein